METCKKEVCKRSDFGQNGNKIRVTSSKVNIYEGLSGVLGVKKKKSGHFGQDVIAKSGLNREVERRHLRRNVFLMR